MQRTDGALHLLAILPLLTILDEAGRSILHRLELASSQEMLVVGKLIARRVRDEVYLQRTPFRRVSASGAAHQIVKSAQRLSPRR
jgi:hypothetical protein